MGSKRGSIILKSDAYPVHQIIASTSSLVPSCSSTSVAPRTRLIPATEEMLPSSRQGIRVSDTTGTLPACSKRHSGRILKLLSCIFLINLSNRRSPRCGKYFRIRLWTVKRRRLCVWSIGTPLMRRGSYRLRVSIKILAISGRTIEHTMRAPCRCAIYTLFATPTSCVAVSAALLLKPTTMTLLFS